MRNCWSPPRPACAPAIRSRLATRSNARPERLSGIVGQRRVQKRVRDRVERRLFGRAERPEAFLGSEVLAKPDVDRASVGVEESLSLGLELDVAVTDRSHRSMRGSTSERPGHSRSMPTTRSPSVSRRRKTLTAMPGVRPPP